MSEGEEYSETYIINYTSFTILKWIPVSHYLFHMTCKANRTVYSICVCLHPDGYFI